jgi:hypothetical protein
VPSHPFDLGQCDISTQSAGGNVMPSINVNKWLSVIALSVAL